MSLFKPGKMYRLVMHYDFTKLLEKGKYIHLDKVLADIEVKRDGDLLKWFKREPDVWYERVGECWVAGGRGLWLMNDSFSRGVDYLGKFEPFMILESNGETKWRVLTTGDSYSDNDGIGCRMGWLYLLGNGNDRCEGSSFPVSMGGLKYFIYVALT